jgi:hypothetical protein
MTIRTNDDAIQFLNTDHVSDAECSATLDRTAHELVKKEAVDKLRESLRYHPRHEQDAGVRRLVEEYDGAQRQKEEEATSKRGVCLHDAPDFAAAAESHRNLPDIVAAFERRGGGGTSDAAYVGLLNLDAILNGQVETRFRHRELTAEQLDAMHENLLDGDVNEPRANVLLRAIEERRGDLLSVVKEFDPLTDGGRVQEAALRRVRARIAASRDARVPDPIKQAIAAIEAGKQKLEHVRRVRKLQLVPRHVLATVEKQRAK